MNRRLIVRAIVGALLTTITYTPILGSFTSTIAAAQTVQNTTSNFVHDAMGNLTQVTDPLGHITTVSYDALNRIKQQVQPIPATGVASPVANFTYDGLDQASTVVDPRN